MAAQTQRVRPSGKFSVFQRPPLAFLNISEQYQKTSGMFDLPWHSPKVVMNAKRRSRYPWRNFRHLQDEIGLVCYQTYTCLWPSSEWKPNVLAAVLNLGMSQMHSSPRHESNRMILPKRQLN